MQNQCFVLMIILRPMSTDKEKSQCGDVIKLLLLFPVLCLRPSTAKQSAKLSVNINETLCWLCEGDARLLFSIHCHFPCPLIPDSGPLHLVGAGSFSAIQRRHGNHGESARSPVLSSLGT